jgi:hypothetical protein
MRPWLAVAAAVLLLAGCDKQATLAQAPPVTAESSLLMWSAFECSVLARMAERPKEQERLFNLGYETGKRFIDAAKAKKFTEEELRSKVPIGVLYNLGGPTTDFTLGVLYAAAEEEASDNVVKKDANGLIQSADKWVTDDTLRKARGEAQFSSRNCSLIK